MKLTFAQWLDELRVCFVQAGKMDKSRGAKSYWRNYVDNCGLDSWREPYDDGESPESTCQNELEERAQN